MTYSTQDQQGERERERKRKRKKKRKRKLVNIAKQNNACYILLGDLTGIRDRSRGRRMNRIVANMPFFYWLTQYTYITYKAKLGRNTPLLTAKEWYSSKSSATGAEVTTPVAHIRACSCVMPVVTLATPITMEQLIPETG